MRNPLDAFPLVRTHDPEHAQRVLSRELAELRIKSVRDRSRFHFEMNGIRLGQTTVAFNRFSTEADVDAGVVEDAVIVSFSVGPPTVLSLDGEPVGADRMGVVSRDRRATIHRAPGSGVLLRAGLSAIEERFREVSGEDLPRPLIFTRSAGRDQGIGKQISRLLSYLIDDAKQTETILENPLLQTGLDDLLLAALVALPSNCSDLLQGGRPVAHAPRVVRQAEQYLESRAADPVTISDVVRECGCSRRALFHAFRQHRGYTPLQFLAEIRLQLARAALRRPAATDTVTSIALACGFSHLGRFAKAYRRRFGEKPSETIRKA